MVLEGRDLELSLDLVFTPAWKLYSPAPQSLAIQLRWDQGQLDHHFNHSPNVTGEQLRTDTAKSRIKPDTGFSGTNSPFLSRLDFPFWCMSATLGSQHVARLDDGAAENPRERWENPLKKPIFRVTGRKITGVATKREKTKVIDNGSQSLISRITAKFPPNALTVTPAATSGCPYDALLTRTIIYKLRLPSRTVRRLTLSKTPD